MIVVQLTGGLGNQLFQYAAAKALSLEHSTELLFEVGSFYREKLSKLETPRDFELYNFKKITELTGNQKDLIHQQKFSFLIEKKIQKILPRHKRSIYKEPFYHFDSNFYKSRKDVFLKGGWQSEKYFQKYNHEIRSSLQLKDDVIANVKNEGIELQKGETVSVHIRRGDYLKNPTVLDWHGILDVRYYQKAFEVLSKRVASFNVVYFSDDPTWVEQALMPIMPGKIISNTISKSHIEDFYLMSQCKHNIIANSTFSWWTAWLNENKNKIVIAPNKWFNKATFNTKDLIPQEWIKI